VLLFVLLLRVARAATFPPRRWRPAAAPWAAIARRGGRGARRRGSRHSALVASLAAAETPVRIAACAALLAVMGLFLGTAFPIGMRSPPPRGRSSRPGYGAVNGATSVLASVLAVIIAMIFGISASFWTGVASYVAAAAAFAAAGRAAITR